MRTKRSAGVLECWSGKGLLLAWALAAGQVLGADAAQPGLVSSEFIYEHAPFPSCHASTIVETKSGPVAAWFGGTGEGNPDVGIWLSRRTDGKWTAPVEVATGVQPDGTRHPCWNPVLFRPEVVASLREAQATNSTARGASGLLLFYKVGPSPKTWWGMLRTSADDGRTWSEARRLPDGILGPIKNKPVQLANGEIVCPVSTEHDGWRVHFERSGDGGRNWQATGPVNDGAAIGAIQPSLLCLGGERLLAVGRTRQHRIFRIASDDGGLNWGPMALTELPNPNSGIDAVTLRDGRHLLVYNHTESGRSPLNVAVSRDGQNWEAALVLEDRPHSEFSYPAVIQAADGLVHITYTWNRQKIRHAVVDPARLELRPIVNGAWPAAATPQPAAVSPVTNGAEWKDGRPVALPGARRPKVESAFLYRPAAEWTYSHHASLAYFRGRYHAIWSNGRRDEDAPGQRVLWSTSADFAHWTEPRPLADSVKDSNGVERVLTAAGFHAHGGTLVAYFGNYGPHKETTHLQAVTTTDGEHWGAVREMGVPVNPNHGPQPTASGRLIVSGNISFPYTDDPAGLSGWRMSGLYPDAMAATVKDDPDSFGEVAKRQGWAASLCEGSFYQTGDGALHMLLRNVSRASRHRLWLSESRDDGASWSAPVETEFSDTNAKFHFGRLPDGRFYYVGNPVGSGRTPLALSLSSDGVRFDRHFILGDESYAQRRPGTYKGGEYGYPHTLVHDGRLCVIVSRQKEAVQVLRVALEELR